MLINYQLTPEDYYQGLLAWRSLRAWRKWLLRAAYFVVATALVTSASMLVVERDAATSRVSWGAVVFAAVWFAYMMGAPRFSARRQFRNTPSAQSPHTVEISEEGLEIHTAHADSKVLWSAFVAWSERKSVFVILPQPRIYVPIPKRAFTEEQQAEFREILRRNVGKK